MAAVGSSLVKYGKPRNEESGMRVHYSLLLAVLVLLPERAFAEEAPQWIVVTAPAFRETLEPLCELRKSQKLRVAFVQTTDVLSKKEILAGEADKLRERVNQLCLDGKGPSYVLLVGMVETDKSDDADQRVLPPLRGTTSRMKGQPSDNGYGCLD